LTLQPDGSFGRDGHALGFEAGPTTAFGFGKGGYSQTRSTFEATTAR
jgi:hypothetical protein